MGLTTDGEDRGRTIATIDRATDVLLLFTQIDRPSLGVTEIANAVGLSKAVVHRVLTTLVARGLIALDSETRRYRLGPMVMALSNAYLSQLDIRREAEPFLREVSARTGETSTLSIRSGLGRIYVDQVTPPREVRMTVQLGVPYPLHAGSSSKAFLAFLDDAEREEYLRAVELPALTPETITSVAALRSELQRIRERGFAVSFGERLDGAASVAAPVFGCSGRVTAVMSACGPLERMRANIETAAAALADGAHELSVRLGYRA
jgi:DNA-binding IclR family transcriptional regulator